MSATAARMNDVFDDEDEGGLSGFTILAILVSLVVIFVLVVMYAYRQGVASGSTLASEELPVVVADPRPIAEDVPPTASSANVREEVYSVLDGGAPTRVVADESPARDPLNGYGGAPQVAEERTAPATVDPEPMSPTRTDPVEAAVAAAVEARSLPSAPSRKPQTQTQPPVQAAAASSQAASTPATTPAVAATPTHVVQVGAFDSNKAALDYFDGLSNRLGMLLNGKAPDIQRAEEKGRTYHRLRNGPITSKSSADQYCAQLKTRGQDCLVRGV